MKKRKHVNAIFTYDDNVSKLLTDALAFYNAISKPPGSTHVTIAMASITDAINHVDTARASEVKTATRAIGSADERDIDVQAVITDIENFVAMVQIAVNNAPDELTAIGIVADCGLHRRKPASRKKNDFNVRNKANTQGILNFIFKAAAKNFKSCYEVQESTDNINWVTIKAMPESNGTYAHGKPEGTKLYFRGRVILTEKNGGAQAWMSPPVAFIFVL
jgi:hypothetical protein